MTICLDPEGLGPISPLYYSFTPCFADSVFPIVTGLALLALAPLDLKALGQARLIYVVPNIWFYLKLGLAVLVFLTQFAFLLAQYDLSGTWDDLRVYATVIYCISIPAAAYVQYFEFNRTRVASSYVLFYWFISALSEFIRFFGMVQRGVWLDHFYLFTNFTISMVATFILFLVSAFTPMPTALYQSLHREIENPPPAESANIFSRLTYTYLTPLMKLAYSDDLTEAELPDLPKIIRTDRVRMSFDQQWEAQKKEHGENASLFTALFSCFGSIYLKGIALRILGDSLAFVQPNLLKRLLLFVNTYRTDNPVPLSGGVVIAIGMFVCSLAQTMLSQLYFERAFTASTSIKASLISSIYRKAMILSNDGRQSKSTGDIVNLMSVDVQRVQEILESGQSLWVGPFQIVLCLYNLHALMGNSMWIGVLLTVLTVLGNGYIARLQRALQKVQMKVKDKRARLTGEMLVSIKSIKLYAWEQSFIDKLNEIRNNQELRNVRQKGIYSATSNFLGSCSPFFVSCATFATFVWTSNKPLSTDIVFPALTLFNLLSIPLTMFPQAATALVESLVSLKRLSTFLLTEELQPDAVRKLDPLYGLGDISVSAEKGTFLWNRLGNGDAALRNISFQARVGELSCIVGRVGSGKSAMLQAILGDLYRVSGSVTVHGYVAYCAQVPFIMNASVKDNILFGKRFHADFYEQTIRACALVEDFRVLPDQDETLVGEKGINLSGGQKARLALARAVYARADVYVFDDPLSAVDQHVGRHIIDNVLGPRGLLASKTRIMTTNAIAVLSEANNITMLREGEVVESGLYTDVMNAENSEIKQLIEEFGASQQSHVEDYDLNEEEAAEKPDPLTASSEEEEEDVIEEFYENGAPLAFGLPLRRASTASFQKPSLMDAVPTRRLRMDKEHSEKGRVKLSVYKEYLKTANVKAVSAFLILIVGSNALSVGGNIWLKKWSDENTRLGSNPDIGKYLGIYLIFGVSAAIFTLCCTLTLWIFCTIRAARVLHDRMLMHVLRSPMSFFDTTPMGRVINRFTADVSRVDEVLARVFSNFFSRLLKVLFSLLVITTANPSFILFITPITVLYLYYQRYYVRISRELKRLESVSRSPIYAHFQESLNGISTIRAYEQIKRFDRTNEYHIDTNNKAYFPSMLARRWLAIRLEALGSLIIFLAALLSVFSVVYGNFTSGVVGLTMSYALQITQAMSSIVRITVEVEISTVSVERILEYCELPMEAPAIIENNRPGSKWPMEGAVEFREYSSRYRPGLDLVLKGINLKIRPQEKVGIVGRTGAGKSSLTLGLFRMVEPAGGYVIIDGVNTSKIGLQDLRERLAIIPQDSQAFEGTVRDNIDPGGKHTDSEIWAALELSHLKAHIEGMEGRLYAMVSEGGSNLSVGQRQLMSLARALLTPSKILVLDEATAAVDVETDHIIQQTIRAEFKDRTILTIAHRLNTIIDSDRIVVLANGRVAEFDTPQALLEDKHSLFYALCKQGGLVE
ncbi:P-loop containing nucleoside triphosphate hydrolase protein [Lipomyces oligophaga]|uniref:P-loop containing nucleoside triphosphate hydrolase protein n=1 Tax=Lipomyces oligophaga TaxID=45792 RepID=UPI0034CD55AD